MPQLTFNKQTFQTNRDESVLDCLLRHEQQIPHACKKGSCHSCCMKADQGEVPDNAQRGLKATEVAQGYFLACSCIPTGDMQVSLPNEILDSHQAKVILKEKLTDKIVRLRLEPLGSFDYRSGQFINLYKDDHTLRSYSIASVAGQENFIELHVQKITDGVVSGWVHDELNEGEVVTFSGPLGSCFYLVGRPEQSLMLIGTGTGLAPLYGIIRAALNAGHTGEIYLFHGSRSETGLYLVDELRSMAASYPQFHYVPCLSGPDRPAGFTEGRANEVAIKQFPDLKGWRVFLCGHPQMVQQAKLKTYLAGASLEEILADPFTPAVD